MSLPPEEEARANFYALLSRLFFAPPDAALLRALASADELDSEDETLAVRWRALVAAAAVMDPEAAREEYDAAFVGTGRAPVTLYTSAYVIRNSGETPLAQLRGQLAALGLARRGDVGEPEDHVAALCDTMRHLIAAGRDLQEQQVFFVRWIQPSVEPLCSAIEASELVSFYKVVGRLAKTFFSLEQSGFEML